MLETLKTVKLIASKQFVNKTENKKINIMNDFFY